MTANAIELTAEQAWFVADALGAGNYPWVLAITPPFSDEMARRAAQRRLVTELVDMGAMTADGVVEPVVGQWVTTTCRPRRWLELRFVSASGNLLRGLVARAANRTVVALRSGGLVTFTALDVDHPQALVPILTAGLSKKAPATFEEFTIPARVGARADEQLRNGASLANVIDYLGIPMNARHIVEAAYSPGRTYVEIVAGDDREGHHVSTEVGVSIVDTAAGRVLVHPSRALDGEWVSTFTPGTPLAIATAIERLTATLPDGAWFPHVHLTRDFDHHQRTEDQLRWRQTAS